MKKRLPLLFIVFALSVACRDKASTTGSKLPESDSTKVTAMIIPDTVKPVPVESSVSEISDERNFNAADSINFKKYSTESPSNIKKAEIDWSSLSGSRAFRTRITEGYKDQAVNFAEHYVAVVFGCGAGCVLGFMVDVRDGKIYSLPLGEENSCFFMENAALMKPDSRLFISAVCKEKAESGKLNYIAYLWDEEKKDFSTIEEVGFLKI